MNLLKETEGVILTNASKKINLDGENKQYSVYKIKLDKLFFNDKNARISTWISQYQSEGKALPDDREQYNKIIEDFIVKSNPHKLNETMNNIEMIDQQEPGVVLKDGRIIDGNRRFTCLRKLHRENPLRHQYFEAIIIDKDMETSYKDIKILELKIQHGLEARVDYNPIDLIVGMYNDIIKNKLMTKEEYAAYANMKIADVTKKCEEAELMVEFLEYINAKDKFFIARDLSLDGPLLELVNALRLLNDEEQKNGLKIAAFNMLAIKSSNQMTTEIRRLKNIVHYPRHLNELIEEQKEIGSELLQLMGQDTGKEALSKISKDSNLKDDIKKSLEKADQRAKAEKTKNGPLIQADSSFRTLSLIDINLAKKMSDENIIDLMKTLANIEATVAKIKEEFDVQ